MSTIKKIVISFYLFLFFLNTGYTQTAPDDTLCTPNPSKEAVALYRYLLDMKGKKILSGQQDSPWGIDEFSYIKTNTGKQPAIKGMDFMTQYDNANEVQKAINYWKAGGIPTIMWHWGAPGIGEGYENSKKEISIDNCFIAGTKEYISFWAELKVKADLLVKLRDANIPIIWRPYHELNGNWFWWGKQGSARFKKLWITMFNYFVTDRGLNNLIWTLCYTGQPDASWYPGDQYVDIAGADTYGSGDGPQMTMFNKVKTITNNKFPIAYHECGIPPNPDQCLAQGGMWSWWMEWHTDYLVGVDKTYLKYVYNHDLVVTLDEVPDIMTLYGWNSANCNPSALKPQIKIGSGEWQQTNKINAVAGTSVILSPQVTDGGTWTWSGYGTSGTTAEQTVTLTVSGTATAVFTNNCGATSTVTFNVVIAPCTAIAIDPYVQTADGTWINTNSITINAGESLILAPRPIEGGSWNWSGFASGTTRELTISPSSSCILTAAYTNSCGTVSQKIFNITVNFSAAANTLDNNSELKIYPSPCTDYLNVNIPSSSFDEGCKIGIYTIHGVLVFSKFAQSGNINLDVSHLKPGMYFLTSDVKGQITTKIFIKEN